MWPYCLSKIAQCLPLLKGGLKGEPYCENLGQNAQHECIYLAQMSIGFVFYYFSEKISILVSME